MIIENIADNGLNHAHSQFIQLTREIQAKKDRLNITERPYV